jgi:uncharacterized membrane protein YgcG
MGRGRQKAKNTKVARELKYFSPNTDLTALEREIGTTSTDDQYEDKWADLYEDEAEDAEQSDSSDDSTAGDSSDSSGDAGSSDGGGGGAD